MVVVISGGLAAADFYKKIVSRCICWLVRREEGARERICVCMCVGEREREGEGEGEREREDKINIKG